MYPPPPIMFLVCFFITTFYELAWKQIIDVLFRFSISRRDSSAMTVYRLERSRSCPYNFYIRFKSKKEGERETYSISTTDGGAGLFSKSQAGVRAGDPQVCCPPRRLPGNAPAEKAQRELRWRRDPAATRYWPPLPSAA